MLHNMKMQLSKYSYESATDYRTSVLSKSMITKILILFFATSISLTSKAQVLFKETFSNVTTVNYGTAIQPSTFDATFDNTGWTSSSSSGQSCAEAGSLCLGKSGSSGGTLTTKAIDMSGSDPIKLSFKLKYYGPNSITGSTSSKISITLNGTTIFSGVKGVISTPTGQPNYTSAD